MKICMIVEDYPPNSGGGGFFVHELSKKLAANHQITVITPSYALPGEEKTEGGIRVVRKPGGRLFFPIKTLIHLLGSEKFDVYDGHGPISGLVAKLSSAVKKGKSILHVHGFRGREFAGAIKYRGQNLLIRMGYDKIISVDESSSGKIESLGIPKNKIITIPPGIDTEKFSPEAGKTKNKKTVFLFVGRFEKVKDLPTLLKAARQVQAEFRLAGDGEMETGLRESAGGNVRFLGRIPHEKMERTYNDADFFTLPSLSEGFPIVLLEAMACGLPTIVSDIPPLKRIAEESRAGFVFRAGDEKQLADVLNKCIELDEKQLAVLKKNARSFAEKHSWEKTAEETEKVYKEIVKERIR